jgi:hypothetical protein
LRCFFRNKGTHPRRKALVLFDCYVVLKRKRKADFIGWRAENALLFPEGRVRFRTGMKRAELLPLVFRIYLIRMWNALRRVIVFVEVRPNESATSMRTVVAGPEAR